MMQDGARNYFLTYFPLVLLHTCIFELKLNCKQLCLNQKILFFLHQNQLENPKWKLYYHLLTLLAF